MTFCIDIFEALFYRDGDMTFSEVIEVRGIQQVEKKSERKIE